MALLPAMAPVMAQAMAGNAMARHKEGYTAATGLGLGVSARQWQSHGTGDGNSMKKSWHAMVVGAMKAHGVAMVMLWKPMTVR